MTSYKVRFVHKIAPSDKDVGPDVWLRDGAMSDSKALGRALRDAGVLPKGGRVRSFRAEGDRTVVLPMTPGLTTWWHAVVLTAQGRIPTA